PFPTRRSSDLAVHALAAALAARGAGDADSRQGARNAGNLASVARLRSSRQRLGARGAGAADHELRSETFGPALALRRHRLGATLATSGHAGGFQRWPPARDSHQRSPDHFFCAGRIGLDAAQPIFRGRNLWTRAEPGGALGGGIFAEAWRVVRCGAGWRN